jgi:hypothetical protein
MLALGNKNFTLRTDVGDLIETTVNKSTIATMPGLVNLDETQQVKQMIVNG